MNGGTNLKTWIVMSVFVLGMACTAAAGRTIYVDDDGPADFNTIQAAIDDANDGDTIIVADGTYTGDGNRDIDFLGKAITLRSKNGPGNCIIDCNGIVKGTIIGRHRGFYFHSGEDANSVLDGFTIINGFGIPGGGIYCSYSSPTIVNCWIIGCSAGVTRSSVGGGIYGSLSKIIKCKVIGNFAALGGGIAGARLIDCIVSGNRAYTGGGVYYAHSMINCILWGNTPGQIYGGVPTVTYSDVQGGWPGQGNIDADPCFAEPGYWEGNPWAEGTWIDGDYHLKSQGGRWDQNEGRWTKDEVTSPCIDAGNPGCPLGDEPVPNGNRRNMGAYGGTAESSKSPANWRSIADMTNDWILDFNDLKVFVSYWLERGECVPSDLNRNESVDFADFCIFGQQWSDTNAGKAQCQYPLDGAVIHGDHYASNLYTELIFIPGPTAIKHTGYFSNNYDEVANRVEDANLGPPPYSDSRSAFYNEVTYFAGLPLVDYWELVRDFYDPYVIIPTTGLESLERGQFYYWTVDETDPFGNVFPSDVWEFAVQDYYAFIPSPPNEAIFIDTDVLLIWFPGYGADLHDVYIGTSWDDVNNADSTDTTGIYKGYTLDPNYQCSNLAFATKYYWRVDEVICSVPPVYCGPYYKGDVWCFTTVPPNLGAIKEDLWFGIAGRAIGDLYSDPGSTTHTVVNHRQDRKGNGGRINMGAYGGTVEASKSYFGEPVCETIVAGDINGDCKVNFKDFAIMALHWLRDENQ